MASGVSKDSFVFKILWKRSKTVFVFTDGRIVVAAVDQIEAPDLAMEFISVCLTNEEAGIVFGRGKADAGRDKKGTFLDLVLL